METTMDLRIATLIAAGERKLAAQEQLAQDAAQARQAGIAKAWLDYYDTIRARLPEPVQCYMQPCYGDREKTVLPEHEPFARQVYEDVLLEAPGCAAILVYVYRGDGITYRLPSGEEWGEDGKHYWTFGSSAYGGDVTKDLEVALAQAAALQLRFERREAEEAFQAAKTEAGLRASLAPLAPDYKIVVDDYSGRLSGEVAHLLREGWRLVGSPFSHNGMLCQALVSGLRMEDVLFEWRQAA